ncbi:IS630 transposase-related protein [Psychrobacter celer]|uniref:IS630 transposase-related protein n=1 Tax=Psychrobacter celer TaxID=306572 RepID=UPI003FD2E61C
MSVRTAAKLYDMSPTTIINWKKDISIKPIVRAPRKIPNDALKQDITDYPDAYYYERAARLGCSKSGVEAAMKAKIKYCFARVQGESYARVPDFIRTNVSKSY